MVNKSTLLHLACSSTGLPIWAATTQEAMVVEIDSELLILCVQMKVRLLDICLAVDAAVVTFGRCLPARETPNTSLYSALLAKPFISNEPDLFCVCVPQFFLAPSTGCCGEPGLHRRL